MFASKPLLLYKILKSVIRSIEITLLNDIRFQVTPRNFLISKISIRLVQLHPAYLVSV